MYGAERLFCLVCCNLQVVGLPYTLFFKYSFFTVRFSKEKEGNAMAVIPVIPACKNPETTKLMISNIFFFFTLKRVTVLILKVTDC